MHSSVVAVSNIKCVPFMGEAWNELDNLALSSGVLVVSTKGDAAILGVAATFSPS